MYIWCVYVLICTCVRIWHVYMCVCVYVYLSVCAWVCAWLRVLCVRVWGPCFHVCVFGCVCLVSTQPVQLCTCRSTQKLVGEWVSGLWSFQSWEIESLFQWQEKEILLSDAQRVMVQLSGAYCGGISRLPVMIKSQTKQKTKQVSKKKTFKNCGCPIIFLSLLLLFSYILRPLPQIFTSLFWVGFLCVQVPPILPRACESVLTDPAPGMARI